MTTFMLSLIAIAVAVIAVVLLADALAPEPEVLSAACQRANDLLLEARDLDNAYTQAVARINVSEVCG